MRTLAPIPTQGVALGSHWNIPPGLNTATHCMAQSLARLHMHLVFGTRLREPWIDDPVRDALHGYMANTMKNAGCPITAIGSVEDHVHLLFELSRTMAPCRIVEHVKSSSSGWIKTQGDRYTAFAWQSGYGIFAVSASNIEAVRRYIAHQREHHARTSFQDEYRRTLERHGVEFDERHIWT
jgi:putative transposase